MVKRTMGPCWEPFPRGKLTAEPKVSSDQLPAALRLSSQQGPIVLLTIFYFYAIM